VAGYAFAGRGLHTHGARVTHFTLRSGDIRRTVTETVVIPRHVAPRGRRPLLVLLHWRGGSPDMLLSNQLFAGLAALGSRAPLIVMPDGGGGSFFHNRRGRAWASYVVNEVVPAAVRRYGADPSRVAIGGTSMGGFGALDIARLWPGRFCAVGAHSPAIFTSARSTMAGSFDGARDFARHDLLALRPSYGRTPVWIDVGTQDRFRTADERFAREVGLRAHVWPGKHGSHYWRAHMAEYLRFYAGALARCGH
jgi:S-formylglutathione hydrolase FrmB